MYRAHILAWRREQIPAPPEAAPDPAETARLQAQARHFAAQRALEFLNDPGLSPGHLIGLLQNENQARQIELSREQFNDRVTVRRGREQRECYRRIEEAARDEVMIPAQMESLRKSLVSLLGIPPHSAS